MFIKGKKENLAKYLSDKWAEFVSEFTKQFNCPTQFRMSGQCVKVICIDGEQRDNLLNCKVILNEEVSCTPPFSWSRRTNVPTQRINETRMVIKGVPISFDEKLIKEETNANYVKRIRSNRNGLQEPTNVVILALEGARDTVKINSLTFKTQLYIPRPGRCNSCHMFGHKEVNCRNGKCCVRCAGQGHDFDNCPAKDKTELLKCRNCGGNHSAAFQGCPKYKEVEQILKTTVLNNMTYAAASKPIKKETKKRTKDEQIEIGNPISQRKDESNQLGQVAESSFFRESELTPIQVTPIHSTPNRSNKTKLRKSEVISSTNELTSICGHLVYHLIQIATEIKYRKLSVLIGLAKKIDDINQAVFGRNCKRKNCREIMQYKQT